MNRVIILEGPDNIGKTYLQKQIAKELMKYTEVVTPHWGPNKTKAQGKKVILGFIDELKKAKNLTVVCDRSPFGEFVYGKTYRDYDPFTYFDDIVGKFNELRNCRFLFISFYADSKVYSKFDLQSKGDEKEEYQKAESAETVSQGFFQLVQRLSGILGMDRLLINCLNYLSLDDRNEYIMSRVNEFMEGKPYKFNVTNNYSSTIFNPNQNIVVNGKLIGCKNYCGMSHKCELFEQHDKFSDFGKKYHRPTWGCGNSQDPKVVFVGEAPGYLGCGRFGLPFYGDRSGMLLYPALGQLRLTLLDVYISNILKCTPKGNDLGKYYDLKERLKLECVREFKKETYGLGGKIIALGRTASNTLHALKINHEFIYHPAYYLRIGKPKKFVDELSKIF